MRLFPRTAGAATARSGSFAFRGVHSLAGVVLLAAAVLAGCGQNGAEENVVGTTQPTPPSDVIAPLAASAVASGGNPLAGRPFYKVEGTQVDHAADAIRAARPADAALLDKIANTPTAIWLGAWNPANKVRANVTGIVGGARFASATPVLAIYRLPAHDCRGYPASGPGSAADYRAWIGQIAAGLKPGPAAVVLEPGVLGYLDCLQPADASLTYTLMREAATTLTSAGAAVYLDISNRAGLSSVEAASRLRQAGVEAVRGFALNTSLFTETPAVISYGEAIAARLGTGAHFVIDTSRNGAGKPAAGPLCNPVGRALGTRPTTATGSAAVDALLWVKMPGESDGTCNGGPAAGVFWTDYALGLASRAAW
ncbi:glycoside hydrolase family 6 protein [Pseudofrankia sp. DC12]|uniref:glycoside hydrolase family 6 protein n=1 Tax=Pseudofrankia sp. DC12 TaxID=683315 RepID=UPI0006982023|nr:glycoside hydrolase family 6 protein [Pseudofrankia sp. DC12]